MGQFRNVLFANRSFRTVTSELGTVTTPLRTAVSNQKILVEPNTAVIIQEQLLTLVKRNLKKLIKFVWD